MDPSRLASHLKCHQRAAVEEVDAALERLVNQALDLRFVRFKLGESQSRSAAEGEAALAS